MDATLEAVKRDGRGKNEARRLRASGRLPAVMYGAQGSGGASEGVSLSVDPKEVLSILHSEAGANSLISLSVGGKTSSVMMREYQLDPVTHRLLHADFYQLQMDRVLTATVPIVIKGESKGVKLQGGMLDFVQREIEVECLPTNIPEHIDVDVTDLALNESIRVRDLATASTWTPLTEGATVLVHVVMPKAEESAQAAAEEGEEGATEPEAAKADKPEEENK